MLYDDTLEVWPFQCLQTDSALSESDRVNSDAYVSLLSFPGLWYDSSDLACNLDALCWVSIVLSVNPVKNVTIR